MARAMWSGYLSFGLVNVPVGMYTATSDQTVTSTSCTAGPQTVCATRRSTRSPAKSLRSRHRERYPVGDGEYIVVTREELKEAAPGKSDTIEISDFVDLDEIDPKYFSPDVLPRPEGEGRGSRVCAPSPGDARIEQGRHCDLRPRDKEHLVAVRPGEDVLVLETMYFDDEIRDPQEELDSLPDAVVFEGRELEVAKQLINSLTAAWEPNRYKNTYRRRVEELIEKKREGKAIVTSSERPKSNVIDLMAALEASVARSATEREQVPAVSEKAKPAKRSTSKKASSDHEQQAFDGMSKAELLEHAAKRQIDVNPKMTKLQLVKALNESEAAPAKRRSRQVS